MRGSAAFERTVVQRLGYLLDKLGFGEQTGALHDTLSRFRVLPWTELEPAGVTTRVIKNEPIGRDKRWHVIVNRIPEIDE